MCSKLSSFTDRSKAVVLDVFSYFVWLSGFYYGAVHVNSSLLFVLEFCCCCFLSVLLAL